MTISLTSVTGAAVTGLTTPGYTFAADVANGAEKSFVVTALTGTQTGVTAHSVSSPFRWSSKKAKNIKQAGAIQGNSMFRYPGKNYTSHQLVKGVVPYTGQAPQPLTADIRIGCPAGADVYDKVNVAAFYSSLAGIFSSIAQGMYDQTITNTQ